ncbi:MAG: GntR family transcriptional regulator [Coriobacteriia bacterium]|nr:GntR family transcriptional regulator [Coriobacteriia bacterium]
MLIRIDKTREEPLYLQIYLQVIAAIARQEIVPGDTLPSVRSLASDLGINLHTVNKAYAVLRDEGYLVMHGRSGAVVADQTEVSNQRKSIEAGLLMEETMLKLSLAHRARGGTAQEFMDCAQTTINRAYGRDE